MNRRLLSRCIAAMVLALLVATVVHIDRRVWHRRGQQAYLKDQQTRYTKYMANPASFSHLLGTSVLVVVLVMGIYESVAFTFYLLLKGFEKPGEGEKKKLA
jgi:hypothetical protein